MKKSLIIGLLGLTVSAAASFGQGFILLDNYNTSGPNVTFGAGSGGSGGLTSGWTVGLYVAQGNILGSLGANTAGNGLVSSDFSGGSFALGAGSGSTAAFQTSAFGNAGQFLAGSTFQATAGAFGSQVTVVLVAYNGANYDASTIRGHSTAFVMGTSAGNDTSPLKVGSFMSGFSVTPVAPVPEPTTFALAGLGSAALLIFRRRK